MQPQTQEIIPQDTPIKAQWEVVENDSTHDAKYHQFSTKNQHNTQPSSKSITSVIGFLVVLGFFYLVFKAVKLIFRKN